MSMGMGPGPGFKTYSGGGSGTLLVGDNTMTANSEGEIAPGDIYLLNASTDWADPTVAVTTGYATKGYARIKDYIGTACKMTIYSSTGVILKVSSPVITTGIDVLTDTEFSFDGTLQIVSGTGYFIGVVCDAETYIGNNGVAWEGTISNNSYASPANFTPGSTSGSAVHGRPKLWITN